MKPCARKQGCAQCIVLQVQTQNPGSLVELTRRKVCSHENAVFSANLLQVAEQLLRQLEIGTRWVPHTTKVNIWKFASQGQYEGVEATAEEVPFKGVDKVAANRFWFCWLYSLCWQNDFLLGFPQAILDCDAATAHQAVHKFNTTATSGCNACLPAIPFAATFEWPIAQKKKKLHEQREIKTISVTAQIQIGIGTHALCQWHYTSWTTVEPFQNKHEERLWVPNLKPRLPSVGSWSLPSTGPSFSLIVVTSSCNCRGLAAACFVSSHPKLKVKAESLEAGAQTFCCCSTLRWKHLPWQVVVVVVVVEEIVVVWVWIKSLIWCQLASQGILQLIYKSSNRYKISMINDVWWFCILCILLLLTTNQELFMTIYLLITTITFFNLFNAKHITHVNHRIIWLMNKKNHCELCYVNIHFSNELNQMIDFCKLNIWTMLSLETLQRSSSLCHLFWPCKKAAADRKTDREVDRTKDLPLDM